MTAAAPVWLYALSLNEMRMLGFFFRHYEHWVDRFIVYDDGSTDGTLAALADHPRVEVRRFERTISDSFVQSSRAWQNSVWKESRGQAAWVVLAAIDEHLHHPSMPTYLDACRARGVTAIPALGFHMISDAVPAPGETLAQTRRTGMPSWEMSKLSIFDPSGLKETNFSAGRHFAEPTGCVVYPETDEVLNLHYKFIDRAYLRERHLVLREGLRDGDLAAGLGQQYDWSAAEFDDAWRRVAEAAVDYRDPRVGFTTHVQRWWRGKRSQG
jgi:hypothetical protein